MKFTKIIKVLCILALTVVSSLAIVACTIVDNTLKFTYENGEELTETVQVELGDLYLVPEVTARQGATEYEVVTVVTDSTGAEVKLTNGKFRPTDTAGYKMTFSAVANEQTTVFEVSLVVVDTVAPTFTIFGTSGSVALIDSTVQVPECTVNDASSTELVASYTVKSPSGEIINAIDGEFTVNAVGDYTITYTATDASGNVGKQEFIYSCKKAKLLNAFDSVETSFSDMSFGRFEKSMWSVDTEYAVDGNAVRFDIGEPSDGVSNWCYLFIKCLKEDGTPYTFNEFKRFFMDALESEFQPDHAVF